MYHKEELTKSKTAYMQWFIALLKHYVVLIPNESFFISFRFLQRYSSAIVWNMGIVLMQLIQ